MFVCLSHSSGTELAAIIEKVQKNADKVEKNIYEVEQNLNKVKILHDHKHQYLNRLVPGLLNNAQQ